MKPTIEIPADDFLEQALSALAAVDTPLLLRLEGAVSAVAAPVSRARYFKYRETFAELLEGTGRNLRFLRRVTERRPNGLYMPGPR